MLKLACLSLIVLFIALAQAQADDTDPTLAEQLDEMTARSAERLPAEMRRKFADAIDEVRQTDIQQSAKQVGDEAPDGTLLTGDEKEITLSDLWKQQPLVITWYRGGWCPYCNLQLRALEKSLAKIKGAGARLAAITPELPENAKETAQQNKLRFLLLHDKQSRLAHKYGIVFDLPEAIVPMYRDRLKLAEVNGYDKLELPLAATYVIDTQGVIRWAFLDADYKKRAEPADVIEAVKKLGQ